MFYCFKQKKTNERNKTKDKTTKKKKTVKVENSEYCCCQFKYKYFHFLCAKSEMLKLAFKGISTYVRNWSLQPFSQDY